jgi:hypothetical protein
VSAIVPLAGGLEAIVDEDDLEMLSGFKWKPLRLSHDTYAVSSFVTNGRHHTIYMHRMVMLPDPALDVDHVNMDGLDNRKDNLRACTEKELDHWLQGRLSHRPQTWLLAGWASHRRRARLCG